MQHQCLLLSGEVALGNLNPALLAFWPGLTQELSQLANPTKPKELLPTSWRHLHYWLGSSRDSCYCMNEEGLPFLLPVNREWARLTHLKNKNWSISSGLQKQCYTGGCSPLKSLLSWYCTRQKYEVPLTLRQKYEAPWDTTPSNQAETVVWVGWFLTGFNPAVFLLCFVSSLLRTVSLRSCPPERWTHDLLPCVCVSIPTPNSHIIGEFPIAQNWPGLIHHHPCTWNLRQRADICRPPKQKITTIEHIKK